MSTTEFPQAADDVRVRFTDTDQCKRFTFCRICRDTTTVGKLWRSVVAKRFDVPGTNWDCPHGWKWGGKPGLVLTIKQKLGLGTKIKAGTSKFGVRPCGGCMKRAAKMDGRQA